MKIHKTAISAVCFTLAVCGITQSAESKTKPNIIVLFADDISAREFPVYESSVWSDTKGKDTTDMKYRAKMPVKQHSWNFFLHVRVMNDPNSKKKLDWWPNTPKEVKNFSINTFGGDV